jgi:hypothetical protein
MASAGLVSHLTETTVTSSTTDDEERKKRKAITLSRIRAFIFSFLLFYLVFFSASQHPPVKLPFYTTP